MKRPNCHMIWVSEYVLGDVKKCAPFGKVIIV
jgi:hypothetical protein